MQKLNYLVGLIYTNYKFKYIFERIYALGFVHFPPPCGLSADPKPPTFAENRVFRPTVFRLVH